MEKGKLISRSKWIAGPVMGLAVAAGLAGTAWRMADSEPAETAAVWANVGGCGSSGGGAAAGAGKWIGRGVSGGLVDVEVLSNKTLGGDYYYSAQALSTTFHWPSHPNYTAGLALAWKHNTFEYEGYKVAEDITSRMQRETGGFGDLGLSFNYLFGNENEHSAGLSIGLPTGQHDIKRLHLKGQNIEPDDVRYMSPFVQPGGGLYSLGASYEWTKTKDWGLIVLGGSYSSAWAWQNWGCRDDKDAPTIIDEKVLSCQAAGPSALTWKLWELEHQGFGENDGITWANSHGAPGTGATGADAISVYGHVGHKEESSTQSIGLTFTAPLAPSYYFEYGGGNDHRMSTRIRTNDYTVKLSGGIEITNAYFPVFLSLGIPYRINDMIDRGRLVDPQNYVGTVGIRGTFL